MYMCIIYMCVCMYVCVCVCICVCMDVCIYLHTRMYVSMYVRTYICMNSSKQQKEKLELQTSRQTVEDHHSYSCIAT